MSANGYPIAYCAPGKRFDAALTLMFKGEQVARITEHPWLEGSSQVIVVAEPPEIAGKTISDKEKTGD